MKYARLLKVKYSTKSYHKLKLPKNFRLFKLYDKRWYKNCNIFNRKAKILQFSKGFKNLEKKTRMFIASLLNLDF